MVEKSQGAAAENQNATAGAAGNAAQPGTGQPRRPGHRGMDPRETVAELTARAHEISQQAGSKVAAAMKNVIGAAAGLTGFAVESARDLIQYMVRRGQMTQMEGDKLLREVEAAHGTRSGGSRTEASRVPSQAPPPPASRPAERKPAKEKPAASPKEKPAAPTKEKPAAPTKEKPAAVARKSEKPAAEKPAKKAAPAKPAAKKAAAKAPTKGTAAAKGSASRSASPSRTKAAAKPASTKKKK